ncbi:MAG: hypothetical protein PVJ02_18385 [Gemmatimonadota bacterium]|jgi:cytochrome c553
MDAHFSEVGAVQAALVAGDLEATREPARWLAEHDQHPDLPQGVNSPMEDLRAFARSVLRAASVADAARCTGEMAAACGRCHAAAGNGPTFRMTSMAPSGETTTGHMMRHDWAMERMWEGLVGPSDRLWEMGATALTADPIFVGGDERGGQEAMQLAREVHDLGATARTQEPEHRAGIYGRLLTTCARCHQLVGIDVRVAR